MKIQHLTSLPSVPTVHKNTTVSKKVMIAKGEIPSLMQFAQATFPPEETVEPHKHDTMYEIYFVEQGEGQIIIDDIPHSLTRGTCITVEPGEMHMVKNTGNQNLVVTLISIATD